MTERPTHLSTIGYSHIDNNIEFEKICSNILKTGYKYSISNGTGGAYYKLSNPEGPELWIGVNRNGEFETFIPNFASQNINKVIINEVITNPDIPFEGVYVAKIFPSDNTKEFFPLIFETPHHLLMAYDNYPKEVQLSLSAFAENIKVFNSEEEFKLSQDGEITFATESFFPVGQIISDEMNSIVPEATAHINGIIKNASLLTNSRTSENFYNITVSTLNLYIDIIADTTLIKDTLQPGSIASVNAWMVGKFNNGA
ncbi:MAG: hypothetical protein AB1782_20340 [Cyanobacteriota bacterium]